MDLKNDKCYQSNIMCLPSYEKVSFKIKNNFLIIYGL